MKKFDLNNVYKLAKIEMIKHSHEILIGLGITSGITATCLAVSATPKAIELLDEAKKKKGEDSLTVGETIKVAWKPYVPAAISTAMSVTCIIGATSISNRRNAALATAYTLSEAALSEYKEKVIETVGEKKAEMIRDQIVQDHVDKNPPSGNETIVGKGPTLCCDMTTGRYFYSDTERIRKAESKLNHRLISEMYVSLNEFYYELGLPPISIGDDLGWNIDHEISIDFATALAPNDTPCLTLNYDYAPRYGYSEIM